MTDERTPIDAGWQAELRDLPDAMHTTPALAAILSGRARVGYLLDVEVALARAEARAGLIDHDVAEDIAAAAATCDVDVPALAQRGAVAGVISLPVVELLRDAVPQAARPAVHLGATSQDVIDTATSLQLRDALEVVAADLVGAGLAAARLADEHRTTPMVGRTLLQQAVPISFGLKAAGWLSGITRALALVDRLGEDVLVLQFGGAAGTLASLGDDGLRVAELLGEELGLPVPDLPWHAERSRVGELVAALATVSGVMAKIATDVSLLMQTEVGEAAEAPADGKGRSSAMPHKSNPVDTLAVLTADRLAQADAATVLAGMPQAHERSLGGWQTEWTAVPRCCCAAGSSVARIRSTLETLRVDPGRMRENLAAGGGLPLAEALAAALAPRLGRTDAYDLVAELARRARAEARHLREVAHEDARVGSVLDPEAIDTAMEPTTQLGASEHFVARALAAFSAQRERPRRPPADQTDFD